MQNDTSDYDKCSHRQMDADIALVSDTFPDALESVAETFVYRLVSPRSWSFICAVHELSISAAF